MESMKRYGTFFLIGGAGYGLIEMTWRGHTHWSMIIAGGICFVIFSEIDARMRGLSLIFKAAIGAVAVTAVELVFGVIFNIVLKMGVWDYSAIPCNLFGQICPIFSLAWLFLSLLFMPMARLINKRFLHSRQATRRGRSLFLILGRYFFAYLLTYHGFYVKIFKVV